MKNTATEIAGIGLMRASPYSRDNVRKGMPHYLLGRGMSALAGFATVILLVRHMDVPDFAAYTAIFGLSMVTGMLAGLGMERALARFIPEGLMQQSARALARLIWISGLLRFLVMLLLIVGIYLLWPAIAASFTGFGKLREFPAALALLLLSSAMFQLFSAVMQALVQQKTLTRVLVVQWGGRLALILLLIAGDGQVTLNQALWLMALPDGAGMLILMAMIHRYLASLKRLQTLRPDHSRAWPCWREVKRLALHNYGYNLLAALPQSSSMIILAAAFLTAPLVAAYGFYISLLERLKQYLPLQFMLNLAEPVLIAGYVQDRDFDKLCHRSRLLYKCNLLLIMPGLAWIAAIAPQLTMLLTGGRYAEYAWILPVLLLQIALGSHATIIQIIINAAGKSEILAVSGCTALAAMGLAIGLVLLSGQYEFLLLAPLAYELTNNVVAVAGLAKARFRYDLQWGFHGKMAIATMVAFGCAAFSIGNITLPAGQILMTGVIALAVFGLMAALLRAADSRDFKTLIGMLQR